MSKSNPVHLWRFGRTRALIFTQKSLNRAKTGVLNGTPKNFLGPGQGVSRVSKTQCTMQLSTQLETAYFLLNFDPNFKISIQSGKNCKNIVRKMIPWNICQIFDSYCQKTCSWCQLNFKFITQANYPMPRKNYFLTGARNIVKMGSEIYKYFTYFFHCVKYLRLFWG